MIEPLSWHPPPPTTVLCDSDVSAAHAHEPSKAAGQRRHAAMYSSEDAASAIREAVQHGHSLGRDNHDRAPQVPHFHGCRRGHVSHGWSYRVKHSLP